MAKKESGNCLIARRSVRFYCLVVVGFLIFSFLATMLLYLFFLRFDALLIMRKDVFILIMGIAVYLLAFYTVYKFYKNVPVIKIDNNSISFYRKTFLLSDIDHIDFTGKRNFTYLFFFGDFMEAATLKFKDGQTKYIFDEMYANAWEIKSFLQQTVIDKKEFAEPKMLPKVMPADLDVEFYDTYNGNQITSYRGIMLWGMVVFFVYIVIEKPSVGGGIVALISWLFLFAGFSWGMNYFMVSQNYLVIKNQNFFWLKRAYRISDIKEIVFETQYRAPNALRVITKDFRSKFYYASTLRDKTWLELKSQLESLGLTVRNECIPERKTRETY